MSKKIIFIILFLIIAAGAIGFWIYRESMFSGEILSLNIAGPATATVGDEITYTIKYKNNGNFTLQNPSLMFYMPDNSLTEDGKTIVNQNLKDIYPGDEEIVSFKTRLLGKEGDIKTAKVSIAYTPINLTVRYESDATFDTKINNVPITLDFDLPQKVEKGKQLQYSVNYLSNIDYPLENLSLKINPINGFDFVSADPLSLDNVEWKLPTLNKTQGGSVKITGNVLADIGQSLTFSAELGMWQNGNFIVIKQASQDVQVIQPQLFISQQVNGSESYVASPGETLHYQVFFRNIGSTPFNNLTMTIKLDPSVLDLSTTQTQTNQAQINGNIITWNQNSIPQLKYLGPQDQGEVDFNVKARNSGDAISDQVNIGGILQNFSIKLNSANTNN